MWFDAITYRRSYYSAVLQTTLAHSESNTRTAFILFVSNGFRHVWQIKLPVTTSALGSHCERVESNLTYLSFASVNAPYNLVRLNGPQNTVIVVCCGNKIKDRQLEQSKRVYVVTTDSFDDLKIAYSVMSSSTCKIYAFRALLIRFHFLLSHKYVSVKVIVMAQSFPAICKGDAVCTVLNICDVGMSEELTRMPSCSNSSVLHPFWSFPSWNPTYRWMWPMENVDVPGCGPWKMFGDPALEQQTHWQLFT